MYENVNKVFWLELCKMYKQHFRNRYSSNRTHTVCNISLNIIEIH